MSKKLDCYNIKIFDVPNNCPTQVYGWCNIRKINNDYYYFIDKRIIDLDDYNDTEYKLFQFVLPGASSVSNPFIKKILCIYSSESGNSDNKYFKLKIIKTNNTYKSIKNGGKGGDIEIDIGEFNPNDKWYEFYKQDDTDDFTITLFSKPRLYKKNQEKISISDPIKEDVYPIYFKTKINFNANGLVKKNIYFYPLIPPKKTIRCSIEVDDTFGENGGKHIELDNKELIINTGDFNYITKKNPIAFTYGALSDEPFRLKLKVNSGEEGFNSLEIFSVVNISYIRFKLNYSSSSFQTCLHPKTKQVVKSINEINSWSEEYDKYKPLTLGQNFNTIIMNKDSDWEYLISEIMPFGYIDEKGNINYNTIKEPVKITIKSSNEKVLKSITKFIIPSNTTKDLRLQRFGDPRDYLNEACLIKLKCLGFGITELSFEIENSNNGEKYLEINKILLCSVGLKIDRANFLLNSSIKDMGNISLEPFCDSIYDKWIANKICEHDYWKINDINGKTIKDYQEYNEIINEYLEEDIMMKPETDISLNMQNNIQDISAEIHISVLNIADKENIDIDERKCILNKNNSMCNFNIITKGNNRKDINMNIIFLVNSYIKLPNYLKHFSTFTANTKTFRDIYPKKNTINIKKYKWPAKQILDISANLNSFFPYNNGMNIDDINDKQYMYKSNNGPEILFCKQEKSYGWKRENIYETKNMYNPLNDKNNPSTIIYNIEKFIIDKIDDVANDSCGLFYGKNIIKNNKTTFDKNFWAKKNINLDFYINIKHPIKRSISHRIDNKRNINTPIKTINDFLSNEDTRPKNVIIKLYLKANKLDLYCFGENIEVGKKKNIKLYIPSVVQLHENVFSFSEIGAKIIDIDNTLGRRKIYKMKLVSASNIGSVEWDIKDSDSADIVKMYKSVINLIDNPTFADDDNIYNKIYWKWDDTDIIRNNIRDYLNEKEEIFANEKSLLKEQFDNFKSNTVVNLITLENTWNEEKNDFIVLNRLLEMNNIDISLASVNIKKDSITTKIELIEKNKSQLITAISSVGKSIEHSMQDDFKSIIENINMNEYTELDICGNYSDFKSSESNLKEDIINIKININNLREERDIFYANLEKKEEELLKPIIIAGGSEYNWLNGKDISITNKFDNYKYFKAEERYVLQFITRYTTDSDDNFKEEIYSTTENEIKNVDEFIKNITNNNKIMKLLSEIKDIEEKIANQKEDTGMTNKEYVLLRNLHAFKLKEQLNNKKEELLQERGKGIGGLYYGRYINNVWVYFWKEWDIKYYIKSVRQANFNEIISYQTIKHEKKQIKILLFCKGRSEFIWENDFKNKIIILRYFNNYYDKNTHYTIEKIENYGSDNYVLQLNPRTNNRLINYEIYDNKVPYWSEIGVIEQLTVEPDNEIHDENCEIIDKKGQPIESETIPGENPADDIVFVNKEIKWASTKNGEIVFENKPNGLKYSTKTQFKGGAITDPRQLELYSKLSKNENESSKDNYYKYSYFESMPTAESSESTFSIYTSGASENGGLVYNTYPSKEFWHPSKIPPINLNIIYLEIPTNITSRYSNKTRGKGVDLLWYVENKENKNYIFEVQKYDAYAPFPEWITIVKTRTRNYFDNDIKEFNTYFYRIRSILYINSESREDDEGGGDIKMVSPYSNSVETFICQDTRFLNGRFDNSITNKKKYPQLKNICGGTNKSISIYKSEYKITKKQLFSKLAKKKGGGLLR